MDEILNLMGRESTDTKTKGWFQLRMVASQNIQNKMTKKDILKLCRKGQEMREVGLPEELQRNQVFMFTSYARHCPMPGLCRNAPVVLSWC